MGHAYRAVGWNRQKKVYDLVAFAGVAAYLTVFLVLSALLFPDATAETLLIRALGSGALLLLHVVLLIGPLHRFFPVLAPLLYNRRHLGVMMFALALGHAVVATIQFHVLGVLNPLVSILTDGGGPVSEGAIPFQLFGLLALVLLFLMAATSHDFWLSRLSAPVWKRLHMGVYAAYVLLVAHVAFGIAQQEGSTIWAGVMAAGVLMVGSAHVAAGWKERRTDRFSQTGDHDLGKDHGAHPAKEDFVRVCRVDEIPEGRAKTFFLAGDRVAVFRHDQSLSAVSSVCRHQGGPLGEGRIVNGCIVCPWHGYEYDPATGASPPPFTERVATFDLRVEDGSVWVSRTPNPPGTRVEPMPIP